MTPKRGPAPYTRRQWRCLASRGILQNARLGPLEQLEDRWNGRNDEFHYDGQAWTGTDLNKLWLKSEGSVTDQGHLTEGQHEFLFDRAISTYFLITHKPQPVLGAGRAWGRCAHWPSRGVEAWQRDRIAG